MIIYLTKAADFYRILNHEAANLLSLRFSLGFRLLDFTLNVILDRSHQFAHRYAVNRSGCCPSLTLSR